MKPTVAARNGRRLRVLHIIQNLNYGGMERLLADLVRRTDPDRFENHILALQYLGRFAEGLEPYAACHLASPLPRTSMVWPGPLIRQIREIGPDVVHTHSGVWYKASLAARLAGVPQLIHTDHGRPRPDPWQARVLDGLASRRTHIIVAVSDALAQELAAGVVRDASRIRVVPNGVDTDAFRPRPDDGVLRAELELDPNVPVLGSIGRLEPVKGYDVMVEAFARLRARWTDGATPPPVLVIAGDGSQRGRLDALIRKHRLEGAARLPGWRDDVHGMHAAFTIFTMSSRSEGTSISLLEAMSSGLCPVVTDVGGNAAVLGPELKRRLVAPGDAEALAAAWLAALGDPSARRADAHASRARVCAAFSLETMVDRYQELYLGGD